MSTTTTNNEYDNQDNKEVCNAFDCSKEATHSVELDVGKFGTIVVNLCSSCSEKILQE